MINIEPQLPATSQDHIEKPFLQRAAEWGNELDLYRSGLTVCPGNAKIHYNVGKILADHGDTMKAAVSYSNAIRLVVKETAICFFVHMLVNERILTVQHFKL